MTTRFAADYAKRVAGCKKCKLQLPKGEIRLAKITPNPFVQNAEGPPPDMKMYYHPHCLFEMFFKARASTKVIESTDDIEGWDAIKEEDREGIVKFIDELTELRAAKGEGTKRTPKKKADGAGTPEKTPTSSKKGGDKEPKEAKESPKQKSKDKEKPDAAKRRPRKEVARARLSRVMKSTRSLSTTLLISSSNCAKS